MVLLVSVTFLHPLEECKWFYKVQGSGKSAFPWLQLAGEIQNNSCGIRLPPKSSFLSQVLQVFFTVLVNTTTESLVCLFFQFEEAEMSLAEQAEAVTFCLAFRSSVWEFCHNFCWSMWPIQEAWNQHFLFLAFTLCVRCDDASCIWNKLTGWVIPCGMCLTGQALPGLLSSMTVSSRRDGGTSVSTAGGCGNLECAGTHYVIGNNRIGEWSHDHLSMQNFVAINSWQAARLCLPRSVPSPPGCWFLGSAGADAVLDWHGQEVSEQYRHESFLMCFPSSLSKSSRNKNYRLTKKNQCTRGKHLVLSVYTVAVLL